MENYYEVLNISPTASQAQIRARFRFLVNAYHPDKFSSPSHKLQAETEFKKINEAYQILSIPQKRAEYDRSIRLAQFSRAQKEGPHKTVNPSHTVSIFSYGRWVVITSAAILLAIFVISRIGFRGFLFLVLIVAAINFFRLVLKS